LFKQNLLNLLSAALVEKNHDLSNNVHLIMLLAEMRSQYYCYRKITLNIEAYMENFSCLVFIIGSAIL